MRNVMVARLCRLGGLLARLPVIALVYVVASGMGSAWGRGGVGGTPITDLRYVSGTGKEFLDLLPADLIEKHQSAVQMDSSWFPYRWEIGQPEFYVCSADTLTHDRDTLVAALYTDGRNTQLATFKLAKNRLVPVPPEHETLITGLEVGFEESPGDIDGDGYPDFCYSISGSLTNSTYFVYLWKPDGIVETGKFQSRPGYFSFRDLTGDGKREIVVGFANYLGSALRIEMEYSAYQLQGDTFVRSEALSRMLEDDAPQR